MKEHPILFSTMMVQANMEDRKGMTRRLVKPQPMWSVDQDGNLYEGNHKGYVKVDGHPDWSHQFAHQFANWKKGDILWVREEHYRYGAWVEKDGVYTKGGRKKWMFVAQTDEILFKAPSEFRKGRHHIDPYTPAWHKRLARFMPKSASRIWLQVTDVRVERLQDISEEDAVAEGVKPAHCETNHGCPSLNCKNQCSEIGNWWNYRAPDGEGFPTFSARSSFESLWESINGADSWQTNPWVWVIKYKVLSKTGKPDLSTLKSIL